MSHHVNGRAKTDEESKNSSQVPLNRMPTTEYSGDPEKPRSFMMQMMFLVHAFKCQQWDKENQKAVAQIQRKLHAACLIDGCSKYKALLNHLEVCSEEKCGYQDCIWSRRVIEHFKRCENATCSICGSIKKFLRENSQEIPQFKICALKKTPVPPRSTSVDFNVWYHYLIKYKVDIGEYLMPAVQPSQGPKRQTEEQKAMQREYEELMKHCDPDFQVSETLQPILEETHGASRAGSSSMRAPRYYLHTSGTPIRSSQMVPQANENVPLAVKFGIILRNECLETIRKIDEEKEALARSIAEMRIAKKEKPGPKKTPKNTPRSTRNKLAELQKRGPAGAQ